MILPNAPRNWPDEARMDFEERAAIMEFHGELPRAEAEEKAEVIVRREYGGI